jgi:catechol 2,3-dioxygenase-like lactoylglutathione lyase family enzyme
MPRGKKVEKKIESLQAPKYLNAVLFVSNIENSKMFYTQILKQKITLDLGLNVAFENGLAIWEKKYAHTMIFGLKHQDINSNPQSLQEESEYYFETDDIEMFYDYLKSEKVVFVHPLIEQPWKQRVFRFYDPDHHIIEIGEPMPKVVIRLAKQNNTAEEIAKLISMPLPFINFVLSQRPPKNAVLNEKEGSNNKAIISFYQAQSAMSTPGKYQSLYTELPQNIAELCKIIQANFNHLFIVNLFGPQLYQFSIKDVRALKREPLDETSIDSIERFLEGIQKITPGSLTKQKSLEERHFAICRDYALLLTSMLRHQGIAARVRCGFATYLNPGFYEDHYVCEYYCEKEKRWILVDSQLDRPVSEFMRIDFNSLDVPRDRFLVAGKVWQEMRLGNINPTKCGIMNIRGRDFIRANVLIDLACLNKAENMMYTIPTGAIYQPCWLSYLGAVAGILKNQKHDFDIVQVGGYSGYVFLVTKNSRNPHSL